VRSEHTHSQTHTHTANRRDTPPEQWAAILLWRPGSDWALGVLLKGTSVISCWHRESNQQPF